MRAGRSAPRVRAGGAGWWRWPGCEIGGPWSGADGLVRSRWVSANSAALRGTSAGLAGHRRRANCGHFSVSATENRPFLLGLGCNQGRFSGWVTERRPRFAVPRPVNRRARLSPTPARPAPAHHPAPQRRGTQADPAARAAAVAGGRPTPVSAPILMSRADARLLAPSCAGSGRPELDNLRSALGAPRRCAGFGRPRVHNLRSEPMAVVGPREAELCQLREVGAEFRCLAAETRTWISVQCRRGRLARAVQVLVARTSTTCAAPLMFLDAVQVLVP